MSAKNNKGSESYPSGYLTQEEIKQIISSINDMRDRLLVRVLYESGCTLIDLVNIKVSDKGGNTIKLSKEDFKLRFARISGKLAKDLSLYIQGNSLQKDSYLFSARQGTSISEKRVRQLIQNYTEKAGLGRINPLSFRYSHIANAYLHGVFIESIALQLGLTTYRIFQVISELGIKPKANCYNEFLTRI